MTNHEIPEGLPLASKGPALPINDAGLLGLIGTVKPPLGNRLSSKYVDLSQPGGAGIHYLSAPLITDLESGAAAGGQVLFGNTGSSTESAPVPSMRPPAPYKKRRLIADMLQRGDMPAVDNGFSFVIDCRGSGHEGDYIPPEAFTKYFSMRQIPIADEDHALRDHDIGHVPSYQMMFSNPAFADMVQQAAQNALKDPEMCKRFAGAIDGFGDEMRDLEGSLVYDDIGLVSGARRNLTELIALLPEGVDRTSPLDADKTLFDYLWKHVAVAAMMRSPSWGSSGALRSAAASAHGAYWSII